MTCAERDNLIRQIMQCRFALVEANLYLDIYPNDKNALDYFRKHNARLHELTAEFEEKYGPVSARGANTDDGWNWADTPWPWETGDMSYVEL